MSLINYRGHYAPTTTNKSTVAEHSYCPESERFSPTCILCEAQPSGKLIKVSQPKTLLLPTPQLTVVYHGVTLNVNHAVEAKWLADVMKALAS